MRSLRVLAILATATFLVACGQNTPAEAPAEPPPVEAPPAETPPPEPPPAEAPPAAPAP